jgi:glycosyltransferase involved in cell wall biosynthesis
MKVSIAVPSLNQGRFLASCLESIRVQSHRDFEVLIADGGSHDESLGVIEDFCGRDERFRLVSRADRGQADAVARALASATGSVCGFLNADDVYLHDRVFELVVREFSDSTVDVVSGGGIYIDSVSERRRPIRLRYHPLDGIHLMKHRTAVLQPATFWRLSLMTTVQLPTDLHYAFDAWFFYDLWQQGAKWRELPDELAGYRLHGDNKSLQVSSRRTLELARFEDHKFGTGSWRGSYLRTIAAALAATERIHSRGAPLRRGIYTLTNSLSYLSAYRIPSI